MTSKEAAEKLGISPSANAEEIRRRFQEVYSDLQLRLANAPTSRLRETYQKNLQEIQAAFEALSPNNEQNNLQDLPTLEPLLHKYYDKISNPIQSSPQRMMGNRKRLTKGWFILLVILGLMITAFWLFVMKREVITFEKVYPETEAATGFAIFEVNDNGFFVIGIPEVDEQQQKPILYLIRTDCYGNVLWKKTLNNEYLSKVHKVISINDKEYVLNGLSKDVSEVLLKIDSQGNKLWEKNLSTLAIYKSSSKNYLIYREVFQAYNEGFFIVEGFSEQAQHERYSAIRINNDGIKIWEKEILAGRGWRILNTFSVTHDGGYIAIGSEASESNRDAKMFLSKFSSNGEQDWKKTYQGLWPSISDDLVKQTQDPDGYLIAASVAESDKDESDMILFKIDSLGNKQWEVKKDIGKFDYPVHIQLTQDGGCIGIGFALDNFASHLVKVDSKGKIQWAQEPGIGCSDAGTRVKPTNDGGYIVSVAGGECSEEMWCDCNVLIKIDSKGSIAWKKEYDIKFENFENAITPTHDGGVVIVGQGIAKGWDDIKVIKVDSEGNIKH